MSETSDDLSAVAWVHEELRKSLESAHKALSFVSLQVCGCHVTGQAKDIAGRVLDSFTLSDCPEPCGAPVAAKGSAP